MMTEPATMDWISNGASTEDTTEVDVESKRTLPQSGLTEVEADAGDAAVPVDSIDPADLAGWSNTPEEPADMMRVELSEQSSGALVRHYQLIGELGAGAMGSVYRARDLRLDREVALKLSARDSLSTQGLERVRREGELTARVQHRNVVTVFDTGKTDDGQVFMVMELLHGETLSSRLTTEGKMDAVEAVRLMLPVIAGLRAAHDSHVLHRDVKPDNIFLAEEDGKIIPKIVDFGVAKRADDSREMALTQAGFALGTPLYMPPEQVDNSAAASGASDVWSVCTIIYEMIAGRPPFLSDDLRQLFGQILTAKPPELSLDLVDGRLWKIIERGLEKSPSDRFSSAGELGKALAHWLSDAGYVDDISGDPVEAWLLDDSGIRRTQPSFSSLTRQSCYQFRRGVERLVVERLQLGGGRLVWMGAALLVAGTAVSAYGHLAASQSEPGAHIGSLGHRAVTSEGSDGSTDPSGSAGETRETKAPPEQLEGEAALDPVATAATPMITSEQSAALQAVPANRQLNAGPTAAPKVQKAPSQRPRAASRVQRKVDQNWGF